MSKTLDMSDPNAFDLERWNPRYALWAKKHGLTPEAMLEKDKEDWPGGCMTGFSLWIQEQRDALCKFFGAKPGDLRHIVGRCGDPDINKVFDQWLMASIL